MAYSLETFAHMTRFLKRLLASGSDQKSIWPLYRAFLRRYPASVFYIVFGIAVSAISIVASILLPRISGQIVDVAVLAKDTHRLYQYTALLLGFFLLNVLMSYGRLFAIDRESNLVVLKIKADVFAQVLRKPWSELVSYDEGYLMSRIEEDAEQIRTLLPVLIIDVVAKAIRLLVLIGILYLIKPAILLFCLAFLIAGCVLGKQGGRRIARISHMIREQNAEKNGVLHDVLARHVLVRIAGRFDGERRRYEDSLHAGFRLNMRSSLLRANLNSLGASLFGLPNYGILCIGGIMVIHGSLTLGVLIAVQMYYQQLTGIANELLNINLGVHSAFASLTRITAFLENGEPSGESGEEAATQTAISESDAKVRSIGHSFSVPSIRFDAVSFSYNRLRPVLADLSFEIEAGSKVALVGASGSGKTTIVRLLLKLVEPSKGRILIGNAPLSELPNSVLYSHIGYVPQTIPLFNRSFRENLLYRVNGTRGFPDSELVDYLRAYGLGKISEETLRSTPEAMKEQHGWTLSGGELQMFAILRELLADPSILIWDEAASSLDSASELNVYAAARERLHSKTLLLISHRLSTVTRADRILVLQNGRLVAQSDSHTHLMATSPYYEGLFKDQARSADSCVAQNRQ